MTRAEQRRLQRESKKNKATYTLTNADIEKIKKDAMDQAIEKAFIVMLGLPIIALHDKFGFGKIRSERLIEEVGELYDSFEKGYVTFNDILDAVKQELGIDLVVDFK